MPGTITPIGVGTATLYPKLTTAGAAVNMLVDPGDTNAPIIFEPPAGLSGGDLEVWVIASWSIAVNRPASSAPIRTRWIDGGR